MGLDNMKKRWKYDGIAFLLFVIIGFLFAPKYETTQRETESDIFVKQFDLNDLKKFNTIYTPVTLYENFELSDAEFVKHMDKNIDYFYISSVYTEPGGEEIRFIQSKDSQFNKIFLKETEMVEEVFEDNIYYFSETDTENTLFWFNDNTMYLLFTKFDYETAKKIAYEILSSKINF